jgi:nitrate reductase delta subunit
MNEETRQLFGLVSRLLDYPDEEIVNSAAEIGQTAKNLSNGLKEDLLDFLAWLQKTPLVELQEEYTRTFDHNPHLCLNLTFHKWGEDKKRSLELVELIKTYRDSGFELTGVELPDYLPMVLEFISACPGETGLRLFEEYRGQMAIVASRLCAMRSPYAKVFEVLDSAFTQRDEE